MARITTEMKQTKLRKAIVIIIFGDSIISGKGVEKGMANKIHGRTCGNKNPQMTKKQLAILLSAIYNCSGATPEEAVANLWLKLNEK